MQFDWTTFALELLNFLVLVWLLQRLLYRPVMQAIDRRRSAVEKSLAEARAARDDAQGLKRDYEGRLAEWAREKEALRSQLHEDLAAERARGVEALRRSLDEEREKTGLLDERRRREALRVAEEDGRAKGRTFAAALLARLASPALERSIVAAIVEDLAALDPAQVARVRAAAREAGYRVLATSRYPLDDEGRRALAEALSRAAGGEVQWRFEQDASLVAGLHIALGALMLQASLRDSLEMFDGRVFHEQV